ncbi:bacillithiol system redox-active protein YtxJ [Metabacillus iocasae]|uniref:Bacillithiol system protein YtxJ n=1 Tax=Priestia iocasae TaxID=2291674 RepID=A0ABS2QQ87_9BACI|nr:bacillithiol system redox-active protein YtxJ [Metabacillus iocasae]MBM7701182.1 bacillithiol system protein YtxJ [Metabacillus iocasae]
MKKISTREEFNQVIKDNETFLFLKHSITCPISSAAYEEFKSYVEENQHIPSYYLHVQEARPLSNDIAEEYNIKHESPQVFLFNQGNVKWHESHWRITKSELANQLNK